MKRARTIISITLSVLIFICAVSCASADMGYMGDGMLKGDYMLPSASPDSGLEGSGSTSDGEKDDSFSEDQYRSGLLTAAAWDDNLYFDMYKALFAEGTPADEETGAEAVPAGKFFSFTDNGWGFNALRRVSVSVKHGDSAVPGARVSCLAPNGTELFSAVTGSDGMAYLFPHMDTGTVVIEAGEQSMELDFDKENRDLLAELEHEAAPKANRIQIMFVIDITGSMGDEHEYLKNELRNVIERISAQTDGAEIEVALLFYRDSGDKEKFAYYDFADAADTKGLNKIINDLSSHNASGGGDYPEAVDEALALAVSKDWSTDSTTRLIFHLLDAPAHNNDNNKQLFSSAVNTAADKGIKICPILASGADSICEYTMRQAAVYTGGTFIFITDHSGIGGEHHDPEIPNIVVEKLNDLLVRVITGHHKGEFADPVPYNAK